jgi:hypothetical protein
MSPHGIPPFTLAGTALLRAISKEKPLTQVVTPIRPQLTERQPATAIEAVRDMEAQAAIMNGIARQALLKDYEEIAQRTHAICGLSTTLPGYRDIFSHLAKRIADDIKRVQAITSRLGQ